MYDIKTVKGLWHVTKDGVTIKVVKSYLEAHIIMQKLEEGIYG